MDLREAFILKIDEHSENLKRSFQILKRTMSMGDRDPDLKEDHKMLEDFHLYIMLCTNFSDRAA